MNMEKYNNALVSNAGLSIVQTRAKYYRLCNEVISNISDITTENLMKEVTFPSIPSLSEEVKDRPENNTGFEANIADGAQSNHNGKIQSNGIKGEGKINENVASALELMENFDVLQNMILKSDNIKKMCEISDVYFI